jgi:hypothetical protein
MWLCALFPYILWTQNFVLISRKCDDRNMLPKSVHNYTRSLGGSMTLAFLQILESV